LKITDEDLSFMESRAFWLMATGLAVVLLALR